LASGFNALSIGNFWVTRLSILGMNESKLEFDNPLITDKSAASCTSSFSKKILTLDSCVSSFFQAFFL